MHPQAVVLLILQRLQIWGATEAVIHSLASPPLKSSQDTSA